MKEKNLTSPGFDPITLSVQVQYATTELKHLIKYNFLFKVL
jgi:hypothetical protein